MWNLLLSTPAVFDYKNCELVEVFSSTSQTFMFQLLFLLPVSLQERVSEAFSLAIMEIRTNSNQLIHT